MAPDPETLAWSDLRSAAADLMVAYGRARAEAGVEVVGEDPAAWAETHEPALLEAVREGRAAYREHRPHWDPAPAEVFVVGVEYLTRREKSRWPEGAVWRALSRWTAGTIHGSATTPLREIGRILNDLDGPTAERLVSIAAGEAEPGELSVATETDARAWAASVLARQMAFRFSADRLRDAIRRLPSPPEELGRELLGHRRRTDADFELLAENFTSFQIRKEVVRFPAARGNADVRAALGETRSVVILKRLLGTDDVPREERRAYFRRAVRHHPDAALRWLEADEIEAVGLEAEDLLGALQDAEGELRQRAMLVAARLGPEGREAGAGKRERPGALR